MTTATMTIGNRTLAPTARPRRSLEELVDRLMNTLTFREEPAAVQPIPGVLMMDVNPTCGVTRAIHEARRLRQSGDLDGALQTLATGDLATAEPHQVRWAFSEWKQLVKRRYRNAGVLVYSQGMGRAAALVPRDKGAAEVVTVLGMKWQPGKLVSRRSLRGLRPLARGAAS